jgi:hypothetical protein
MVGYLAVDSGVQPPLLVQILPTVVGGTLALAAAIYHGAIKWSDANFTFVQVRRLRGHTLWSAPVVIRAAQTLARPQKTTGVILLQLRPCRK